MVLRWCRWRRLCITVLRRLWLRRLRFRWLLRRRWLSAGADLVAQMLDVVADKTGYPVEMLDLSMALEADLGIDSIKRVEILSAVQERIPGLPDVETATMAALVTLQEIVDYLQSLITPAGHNGVAVVPVAPVVHNGVAAAVVAPAAVSVAVAAPVAVAGADLVAQMLDVVADKTGYPVEMLDLSMALEADLGIDSIKRVEILSAVQERIPGLPDVETATMAALVTLQEIVDYLQSLIAPAGHNGAPTMPAPPPTPAPPNGTPVGDRLPFELAGAAIARHTVRAVAAPASGMGMPACTPLPTWRLSQPTTPRKPSPRHWPRSCAPTASAPRSCPSPAPMPRR